MDFSCAQLKLHNVFGIPAFHQLRSKPPRYNADIMGTACLVNAGMFDNTMCTGGGVMIMLMVCDCPRCGLRTPRLIQQKRIIHGNIMK